MKSEGILGRAAGLMVALALTTLAGCGGYGTLNTCRDPCSNPKFKRDLFCNCYDPEEYQQKPPGSTPPQALSSACVCQQPDGTFEAWFRWQPQGFQSIVGKSVVIAADDCEDLSVCPFLSPDRQVIWTGRGRMQVEAARKIDNFIQNRTSWTLSGPLVASAAFAAPDAVRLASADPTTAPVLDSTPHLDCAGHCSRGDEYCLRAPLPGAYVGAVGGLIADVLDGRPNMISVNSMKQRFGVSDDPCQRGDVLLSGGEVRNEGLDCTLTASSGELGGDLRLLLPSTLLGVSAYDSNGLNLAFTDPSTAPRIGFSNPDIEFDFGGEIRRVNINRSTLTMETYNGCVQLTR